MRATTARATRTTGMDRRVVIRKLTNMSTRTAKITGDDTQKDADYTGDDHGGYTNEKRDAGAVHEATQVVTAQIVGSQGVFPGAVRMPYGINHSLRQLLMIGVMRRNDWCKKCQGKD